MKLSSYDGVFYTEHNGTPFVTISDKLYHSHDILTLIPQISPYRMNITLFHGFYSTFNDILGLDELSTKLSLGSKQSSIYRQYRSDYKLLLT